MKMNANTGMVERFIVAIQKNGTSSLKNHTNSYKENPYNKDIR